MRVLAALVVLAAVGVALAFRAVASEAPVIAAAADLRFALTEIAEHFETDIGESVRLSFGSSGNFARQIRDRAPFELYLSADEQYVLDLARAGYTRGEGDLYATGRIAIIAPHGSALEADGTLGDLRAGLEDGRVQKFAIANPEHAPYGRAAQQALRHADLWEQIQPRLVLGENVSQAAQFALSGSAQGGIIAYSLALSPEASRLGTFELVPEAWHEPLRQRMVLLESAGPVAERFYAYLQEPTAREIFRKYGFVLPGETS